jgi:hypothetical protein
MVHALRDACRVLVPDGTLIDLRPLATIFRIDAIVGATAFAVGEGDTTASAEDDRAADRAVADLEVDGSLVPHRRTQFELHFYWDTTAAMAADLRAGRRPKPVTPTYEEIDAALRAAAVRTGYAARLRSTRRMMLASYTKSRRR